MKTGTGPVSLIIIRILKTVSLKAKWKPRVCCTGLDQVFYQNEVEKKKKDLILDGTLGARVLLGLSSVGTFRVGTC